MTGRVLNFDFKDSAYEVSLKRGVYIFEAWGASGFHNMCGKTFEPRGRGAYTSGIIKFNSPTKIFVFVGKNSIYSANSFNGNINNTKAVAGGGATDFRLVNNKKWYDLESLKSRIMVAAGGGGADCYAAGDGGALVGHLPATLTTMIGVPGPGNQTNGGDAGVHINQGLSFPGEFGVGGSGRCQNKSCDGAGSGGGGYYGGGGMIGTGGGGGGSSFISGYEGCKAIDRYTLQPTESPIHYSGHSFTHGVMRSGNEEMPNPRYHNKTIGNTGNGFARITLFYTSQTCFKRNIIRFPSMLMVILTETR